MVQEEAAIAVLLRELARPPSIAELTKLIVEKGHPGRVILDSTGLLQAKLSTAKSLDDLEKTIEELLIADTTGVVDYLHTGLESITREHAEYFRALLEAGELELLYSQLSQKTTEAKYLRVARIEDYADCAGLAFSCIIKRHLDRVLEKCTNTRSICGRSLLAIVLYDVLIYNKYFKNLEKLELRGDVTPWQLAHSFSGYLSTEGIVYLEPSLSRVLGAFNREEDPIKLVCSSYLALHEEAKFLLYYTSRLVDVLTLYAIDRLLRYSLLRVIYSRWLKPW